MAGFAGGDGGRGGAGGAVGCLGAERTTWAAGDARTVVRQGLMVAVGVVEVVMSDDDGGG